MDPQTDHRNLEVGFPRGGNGPAPRTRTSTSNLDLPSSGPRVCLPPGSYLASAPTGAATLTSRIQWSVCWRKRKGLGFTCPPARTSPRPPRGPQPSLREFGGGFAGGRELVSGLPALLAFGLSSHPEDQPSLRELSGQFADGNGGGLGFTCPPGLRPVLPPGGPTLTPRIEWSICGLPTACPLSPAPCPLI